MKKIAKLSLVAAIAVSGFTSANAQPLEEAIKNVDVSGSVVYRYDDRTIPYSANKSFSNESNNSYKIAVNLKSAINDDLTLNTRTIIGTGTAMAEVGGSTTGSDGEATFGLSHANFAYTGIMNTTVIAGKQAVPSPFAVQADAAGDEDTGTGITAISNLGVVTVAGTYLNQTNLGTAGQDIAGLGLMADIGPVSLDSWYLEALQTSGSEDDASMYTLGAKAKIEMVDLTARYSAIDADATGVETQSIWKVGAKAKLDIVTASIDYGKSSDSNLEDPRLIKNVTGDADAEVNLQAWALNLNDNDATLVITKVGVDVLPPLNLTAVFASQEVGTDENKEYYGQATYKMGKNFQTYVRLGEVDMDSRTEKDSRGRLHVQYTF